MPKTSWLTGPDLMVEKKRRAQRDSQSRRRAMDRPATAQNKKVKTKYTAWSEHRCRVCSALVWFDTRDGELIPMDPGTRTPHKHSNG